MKIILINLLLIIAFISCNTSEEFPPAENALDAAREYVDGTLKGEFKKSEAYLLKSQNNKAQLDKLKQHYYQFNDIQRQNYRKASIIIERENNISDKESVIYFQNSFDKQKDSVTVIQQDGLWLVNFEERE